MVRPCCSWTRLSTISANSLASCLRLLPDNRLFQWSSEQLACLFFCFFFSVCLSHKLLYHQVQDHFNRYSDSKRKCSSLRSHHCHQCVVVRDTSLENALSKAICDFSKVHNVDRPIVKHLQHTRRSSNSSNTPHLSSLIKPVDLDLDVFTLQSDG